MNLFEEAMKDVKMALSYTKDDPKSLYRLERATKGLEKMKK